MGSLMDLDVLFSTQRLSSYKSYEEHRQNLILIKNISAKIGLIEIVSRNKIANLLNITDGKFISHQSFGYWVKELNDNKLHNKLVDFTNIDFRKYSKFNIKFGWRNYQKVKIIYSLLVTIRNRAFHFENLYKTNQTNGKNAPRITTKINKNIIGIEPNMIENYINDALECFDKELVNYIK